MTSTLTGNIIALLIVAGVIVLAMGVRREGR
ncbi:hypothetical protein FDH08_gp34 [Propionibacterium phage B22]|uniref:Uncharacterized protein n=2 Tax=Doucettevirus TaxID=2169653 RepID=A0A1D8EUB5_9CAUD|nr:hypothetical protein FDH08_gp34 [Propionibacterium phage B22]YP_009597076.1 hypothetical protein FDH12_gp34 [Propionibacterium phage G4]CEG89017.1 Protein of unknown function [Propionibacterium freudenreichii]AOT24413.1 hypothetical protein B22_34 [Propionibacterium phage B22]AOT24623.1 hypothetical protein G4_34 [Propionibacterium phage G4]CEH08701.1 Protein of unknown function [Propionibacterium freudenreichii]SBW77639.1 Hypothetical protein PFR_JS22-1_1991 [Propionibacterium freudenreic